MLVLVFVSVSVGNSVGVSVNGIVWCYMLVLVFVSVSVGNSVGVSVNGIV